MLISFVLNLTYFRLSLCGCFQTYCLRLWENTGDLIIISTIQFKPYVHIFTVLVSAMLPLLLELARNWWVNQVNESMYIVAEVKLLSPSVMDVCMYGSVSLDYDTSKTVTLLALKLCTNDYYTTWKTPLKY